MCGRARLPNDYSEIKIKLKIGNAVAPKPAPILEHRAHAGHAVRDLRSRNKATHGEKDALGFDPQVGEEP